MTETPARDTRRWRIRGFNGKDVVHESTCTGDAALNDAIDRLEADPNVTRYAAGPA